MFGFKNILNIFIFEKTEENYKGSFNFVLKNMDSSTSTSETSKNGFNFIFVSSFLPFRASDIPIIR